MRNIILLTYLEARQSWQGTVWDFGFGSILRVGLWWMCQRGCAWLCAAGRPCSGSSRARCPWWRPSEFWTGPLAFSNSTPPQNRWTTRSCQSSRSCQLADSTPHLHLCREMDLISSCFKRLDWKRIVLCWSEIQFPWSREDFKYSYSYFRN